MPNQTYDINVRWTGEHYEASIPALTATAVGATIDEALTSALRVIMTTQIQAEEAAKRGKRKRRHTVA